MRTQSHGHDPTYDIHVLTPPHLPPPLASVLQATLSLPRHIIEMTGQQCEGGRGELTEEPRDIVMQKNTTDTGPTNNDDHCLVEQE